jgi:hypothetical protein
MPGCEICLNDSDTLVILPIHQPNGSLITIACEKCAEKSSAYCKIHHSPHRGFEDGATACKMCIDNKVEKYSEEIAEKFKMIVDRMESSNLLPFTKWLIDVQELTGENENICIARAIITYMERKNITLNHILHDIITAKNANMLIPAYYLDELN